MKDAIVVSSSKSKHNSWYYLIMRCSAVVLTCNSASFVGRCLESLLWCDEIVIVDDYSSDDIDIVAKKYGARVIFHKVKGDFAAQRNYVMNHASYEWLLYVDADEVVSPILAKTVGDILLSVSAHQAYAIPRMDVFWGKELRWGEMYHVAHKGIVRLVHRDAGVWKGRVHETFHAHTSKGYLSYPIYHYPHPTMTAFLQSINKYSSLRAHELYEQGKQFSLWEVVVYPVGKWLYTFLVLQGFRDGVPGFVYSFLMSFHSFLVRAKLFQLRHAR